MKRKAQWSLLWWLLSVVVMSTCGQASSSELHLSIAEAVELGLKQNPDMQLARLAVHYAEKERQRQEIVDDEEAMAAAVDALAAAENSLHLVKENLIFEVEKRYYDLLRTTAELTAQQAALADLQQQYTVEQSRFAAGLISELSLVRSQNQLLVHQATYARQEEALRTQQYRFNEVLGQDLTTILFLTDKVDLIYAALSIPFSQVFAAARTHSDALLRAEEQLAAAIEAVAQADNDYTPRVDLEGAIRSQQEAAIRLEQAANRVFFDARAAYLSVEQAQAAVEARQRDLEYAAQNLRITEARYRGGVVSEEERLTATAQQEATKDALTDAIWTHLSARRDLYRLMGRSMGHEEQAHAD